MYILYLDDSGSVKNAADKHIVLAGLAVFERQTYWLGKRLDELAGRMWPESPETLEFHGTDIRSGKRHWRGLEKASRVEAMKEALQYLARDRHVRLFGAAIHKAAYSPDDPMERAFEQVINRFDRYLGRLHKSGDTQRGLIVLDESSYETSLQALARDFRTSGHSWGTLKNISEVPLFVDSRATRLIQYADLVAYAMGRYYNKGDDEFSSIIASRFDHEGGVIHGLTHFTPPDQACNCYSCRQRALLV
jgi:hypothetical protein